MFDVQYESLEPFGTIWLVITIAMVYHWYTIVYYRMRSFRWRSLESTQIHSNDSTQITSFESHKVIRSRKQIRKLFLNARLRVELQSIEIWWRRFLATLSLANSLVGQLSCLVTIVGPLSIARLAYSRDAAALLCSRRNQTCSSGLQREFGLTVRP